MSTPILWRYDWIVVNTSAGKDSQAMLDHVCELAAADKCLDKVVVVHADLGRVEWKGTRELAEEQARHYGVRFEVVRRPQGDLLTQIEERGMFPSPKNRYCTSDQKRGQVDTLFTQLTREFHPTAYRRCRILNCMGLRADESPARAKKQAFVAEDKRASNSRRQVSQWLPIHGWNVGQVWERIKQSGVRHHPAYDLGMPRLSCCFCIFATRPALLLAGKHNAALLEEYVQVEKRIDHTFRENLPLASIQRALAAGEEPGKVVDWSMA